MEIDDTVERLRKTFEDQEAESAKALGLTVLQLRAKDRDEAAAKRLQKDHEDSIRAILETGACITSADRERIATETLGPTKALKVVDRWLDSNQRFLVLAGHYGTGKTVAAVTACVKWRETEEGGMGSDNVVTRRRLVSSGLVVSAARLGVRNDPWSQDVSNGFTKLNLRDGFAPHLVVDDLGTEILGENSRRFETALFEVVNMRQDFGRTIFTTNLTRDGLRKRYDPRVIDRIEHQGAIVEMKGESLRGKGTEGGYPTALPPQPPSTRPRYST